MDEFVGDRYLSFWTVRAAWRWAAGERELAARDLLMVFRYVDDRALRRLFRTRLGRRS